MEKVNQVLLLLLFKNQKGKQSFIITDHDSVIIDGSGTIGTPYIHVDILAWLGEYMGIIAPGTADRTNEEGNNIHHYDSGVTSHWKQDRVDFVRWIPFTINYDGTIDSYVKLHNEVTWEIIGLDSGWFQHVFMSKYRGVRIFSNICDWLVLGDRRTNVLGEAKVNAALAEGQQF